MDDLTLLSAAIILEVSNNVLLMALCFIGCIPLLFFFEAIYNFSRRAFDIQPFSKFNKLFTTDNDGLFRKVSDLSNGSWIEKVKKWHP